MDAAPLSFLWTERCRVCPLPLSVKGQGTLTIKREELMPVPKPRSRACGMKLSPALCPSDVCGSVVLVVLSFLPGQPCLDL